MRNLKEYPITEDEVMKVVLDIQCYYMTTQLLNVEKPVGDITPFIARNICDFLTEHTEELAKRMEIKVE